jgi:hypothetical protein
MSDELMVYTLEEAAKKLNILPKKLLEYGALGKIKLHALGCALVYKNNLGQKWPQTYPVLVDRDALITLYHSGVVEFKSSSNHPDAWLADPQSDKKTGITLTPDKLRVMYYELNRLTNNLKEEQVNLASPVLHIDTIVDLLSIDADSRSNYLMDFLDACKEGTLRYTGGNVNLIEKQILPSVIELIGPDAFFDALNSDFSEVLEPLDCWIHRDDFKAYFQPIVDCQLVNWWPDSEQEAEPVDNPRLKFADNTPISNSQAKAVVEWNETLHNGQPIDWGYWKDLKNITPAQAAKLAYLIDPILWPDDRYASGKEYYVGFKGEKIDDALSVKLRRLEQRLENHSLTWNLVDLVKFLDEDNASFGMLQAVKEVVETELKELDEVVKLEEQDKTAGNISPVSKSVKGESTGKNGANQQRTRKVNLTVAIHAAVATFDKKPSLDELWKFFEEDKDETGIIEDFTDDQLTWKDTRGKLHDTKKATIANHLSRIKN